MTLALRVFYFYHPRDHIKNAEFAKEFKEAIIDCLSNPDSPDSHVLETVSSRGTLFQIVHRDEAIRRMDALISETDFNSRIKNLIYKYIKDSKEKFVGDRLRLCSVELLMTHRYLEEDLSFYKKVEDYFDWCLSINEQLAIWEHFPKTTPKWFVNMKKRMNSCFGNYRKAVNIALKKLIASSY